MILRDLLIVLNAPPATRSPRIREHLRSFSPTDWAEARALKARHERLAVRQAITEAELLCVVASDEPINPNAVALAAKAARIQDEDNRLIHQTNIGPAGRPLQ